MDIFDSDVEDEEFNAARKWLLAAAASQGVAALVMIFAHLLFVALKLAVLQVAGLVLLPLVLLPLAVVHFTGRRAWRVRDGGHLILWLRRFHRDDLRRFPFGAILGTACGGRATPITIQDSTYRHSYTSLVSKGLFTISLLGVFGVLLGLVVIAGVMVFWLVLAETTGLEWLEEWPMILSVLLCLPLLAVFPYLLLRRACFHRLKADKATAVVARLADRIRAGRHSSALQILKCGDDFWRETVEQALKQATAAVVDVTAISENVRWELAAVKQWVPAERVLLVTGSDGVVPLMGEDELIAALTSVLGPDYLLRTRRMIYEIPEPSGRLAERIWKPLRDLHPALFAESREALQLLTAHLVAIVRSRAGLELIPSPLPKMGHRLRS